MTSNEIKDKITMVYKILLKNDHYLLEKNVNERAITHKLAEYLQMLFPEYNVDCEYNKNFKEPNTLQPWDSITDIIVQKYQAKKLSCQEICRKLLTDAVSVCPDLIIHKRGTDNNLVVIEVKKKTNHEDPIFSEKLKLEKYKDVLGFEQMLSYLLILGFSVEFSGFCLGLQS